MTTKPLRPPMRQAILDAAIELLARNRGASLSEIAARAGVGRASLHRHFPSRTDLIAAVVRQCMDETDAATVAAVRDAGSARETLSRLLEAVIPLGDRYHFLAAVGSDEAGVRARYEVDMEWLARLSGDLKKEGVLAAGRAARLGGGPDRRADLDRVDRSGGGAPGARGRRGSGVSHATGRVGTTMTSTTLPLRLCLALGGLLVGLAAPVEGAGAASPGDRVDLIGVRVVDTGGGQHRIGVSAGTPRPSVLVFLDTVCPVATRYVPVLNELHRRAQAGGVSLYGVLSNPDVTWGEAADFARGFEVRFPVIMDSSGDLARRLGPRVTSEVFAVSTANRLVYRGRVNDRFAGIGRARPQVTSHDLRDVIDALARGSSIEPYEAEAVGCFHHIWGERGSEPRPVTYTRHVAPLLEANCTECPPAGRHRALRARGLCGREALEPDDRLRDRGTAHAAVARGARVRRVPGRPPPQRAPDRAAPRLGGRRRAAR